jgi:endoglucanase
MATAAQAAITAIRGQNANQYIFVEGGGSYAACKDFASGSPSADTEFLTLEDPKNALIAECHAYTDSVDEGNTDIAKQGMGLSSVTNATTFASQNNIHLFLGETGLGFTPSSYAEEKAMFDYMAANPTVWIGWTAWGGGAAWPESYDFLFEPRATNYSPVVTPFIDRPMMRFLNTYATGRSWPAASGAWPFTVQFP